MSLGKAGKPRQRRRAIQPAERRGHRARRQHLCVRRSQRAGHDTNRRSPKASNAATRRASASSRATASSSSRGASSACSHGEFRTPHALVFDSKGRLWVADRGNHRIEIFDQDGKYLESRYTYGRISGLFIKEQPGLRDRLGVEPAESPELAQRRAHRSAGRGSHHRVHAAVRARGPRVSGHGGRRRGGGCGRQRLRGRRAELTDQAGGAFTKYSVK